ncbi:MAG: methionine--tRNA ligase [Candidatus Iainarchaeum archaeon]|uniref:methionine--tRNA ligase n=1 Tax=Candidatus Iainarchaeum sp. TaxID=3101447 RepID=A0A7T9DJP7_9ARCH|nr:MAG: methionine--tRNA ligase [Candidatus Diapherotrites archaeon]
MPKDFFITCAIDYPNASLHMGHLYEKTIADVIARVHRLNGEKVFFLVGMDEHGEKIQETAKKAGISPQAYVDQMFPLFQSFMDNGLISYDRFIRTTDKDHVHAATHAFQQMVNAGDIYLGEFEGWYCVSDETYWTEKELVDGPNGTKLCPNVHCKKPVQRVKEESYFFKWSKYQSQLEKWFDSTATNVFPAFRKNEMREFLSKGLHDVSFTRQKIAWGIPAPINPAHTIYVWGDALVNYLTACGYPHSHYTHRWPADLHVIGMDINRFHSLLWPAMLLSMGVELPKQVFVHGFVNDAKGEKMSKSLGNVVDPQQIIPEYGIEPIRYYLLKETPVGNDLSFSIPNLIERTNADLADSFGNLAYRVLSMIEKYNGGIIPQAPLDQAILVPAQELAAKAYHAYLSHSPQEALHKTWDVIALGNKSIAEKEPWKLMKENKRAEVEQLLRTEVELLRMVSILIAPVLPLANEKLNEQFGFETAAFAKLKSPQALDGKPIKKGAVLFAKKEVPKPAQ